MMPARPGGKFTSRRMESMNGILRMPAGRPPHGNAEHSALDYSGAVV